MCQTPPRLNSFTISLGASYCSLDWATCAEVITVQTNHMHARTKASATTETYEKPELPPLVVTADQAADWASLTHQAKTSCLVNCAKTVQQLLNKLVSAMQNEQIAQHYQRCRDRMSSGDGEIKRALHKVTSLNLSGE